MNINVFSVDGSQIHERSFKDILFIEESKGPGAFKLTIQAYQANNRQGTAAAKGRGAVKATGKKMYRQKGTGNARHGDRAAPIFVGGGVAFPPHPRDYSQKINKKVKLLALKWALLQRIQARSLLLIEGFSLEAAKTKLLDQLISKLFATGKVLLIDVAFDEQIILAARNLERVFMIDAMSLSCWDLARYEHVLVSANAFDQMLNRCNF